MKKLRDYQIDVANKAAEIIKEKKLVAIFAMVRVGKTLMSLQTCENIKAKDVLFITKKKAISSIEEDYNSFNFSFNMTTTNRESLHNIESNNFDVVIIDEIHGYTSYPKPSKYYKDIKKRFGNTSMIFLSGTPTPESYSQFYHLFSISNHHSFSEYTNFYKWAKDYVNVKQKRLGYGIVNDYSEAKKESFFHLIEDYIITFTQEEAGFTSSVEEIILEVEMKPITSKIISKLCKDLVVTSSTSGKVILADTAVKLQQKVHQLSSGTIKYEDGTTQIIDDSKALFIKENFKNNKIAIFYNFIAELEMLKNTIGSKLTTDLEEFNNTDKWIALQIQSGREGVSLAKADALIMFNIQFSAVSYFQSKERLATINRLNNKVYWIFSKGKDSIERKIYNVVKKKKNFTTSIFIKNYNIDKESLK
jgi:X-X-X-Leu-X-X-Gly heptad repeat protein